MFDKSGLHWVSFFREEDEDEAAITDPDGNPVEKPAEPSESKEGGEEVSNLPSFTGFTMKCLKGKFYFAYFFVFIRERGMFE